MNRFLDKAILPIIKEMDTQHIVEIGCAKGISTKKILSFCKKENIKLSAIDPNPMFDISKLSNSYKNIFVFYEDISLKALPLIKNYDVVLIDGDHNWYTVYNELKLIEEASLNKDYPIVFIHDVSWPYGRRDLYYNPENIPIKFRHSYKKAGIKKGKKALLDNDGLNSHLNNAIYEGNEKNGVLTAVEDFLYETLFNLSLKMTDKNNGLGVIFPQNILLNKYIEKIINEF